MISRSFMHFYTVLAVIGKFYTTDYFSFYIYVTGCKTVVKLSRDYVQSMLQVVRDKVAGIRWMRVAQDQSLGRSVGEACIQQWTSCG